jgi:hypothetical protein
MSLLVMRIVASYLAVGVGGEIIIAITQKLCGWRWPEVLSG